MKKFLKILGILVAIVLVIAAVAFISISSSDIPSYDVVDVSHEVTVTPDKVARGKKLASMLCVNCHLNTSSGKLSGKPLVEIPKDFGVIHSTNITQHREYGIGNYTDGELLRLFRTGIKKNGQYAPPYMSKLPLMADADIDAIIAFLRSDDPWVQADPSPTIASQPSFLVKFLCKVEFKPFEMPASKIELPDTNNKADLGKYLALNLECFSCHSADFKSNDYLEPHKSVGFFGGGNKTLNANGEVILTQNLTFDNETGLGNWTEEQFISAVKYGLKEGEPALRAPMLPYSQFTDYEISAIFEYLKTVPVIANKVERSGI